MTGAAEDGGPPPDDEQPTVASVDVAGRSIPFERAFPVSYEAHTDTEHVFVRVRTDDGRVGYGEGTALPWFTGETTASMAAVARDWVAPRVAGESPDAAALAVESFGREFPANPGAKSAVEMALCDLRARRDGVGVHRLLGPRAHETIPEVFPVPGLDPDEAVALVREALADGFRRFKVKATGDVDADVARIDAVLAELPDGATARIDPNTSWERFSTAAGAVARLDDVEAVEYLEQPVPPDRPDDLRRLREETGLPVFADEAVHGPADVRRLAAADAVDGCCLKLAKLGGLGRMAHVARVAREHDLAVTVVSAFGTSLEAAANLHLAATVPNLSAGCELAPMFLAEDPATDPIAATPTLSPPVGPGLGVDPADETFGENRA